MRSFIFLLFTLFFFSCGFSQTEMDFVTADRGTYKAWNEKRWHDLLDTCEMIINETNIDYFYLRMRAGVAAYELHKYRKAVIHFEKALEFSSGNKDAVALLVSSKIYAGYYHSAAWTDTAIYGRPYLISSVYVDYGNCENQDYEELKLSYNKPKIQRNLAQDMKLNGPFSYYSMYLVSELSALWQLNSGFSYLSMAGYNQMRFDDNTVFPSVNRIFSNTFNVNQYGIYLAPSKHRMWNKVTTYFFHGFLIRSDVVDYKVAGVVLPPAPPMGMVPSPVSYLVNRDSSDFTSFEAAFGISFRKNRTYISRELSVSAFTSEVVKRIQLGYSFTFYPGSKSGFSSSTSVYGLAGNGLGFVAKQSFYIRAGKYLNIEPYIMYGDISYFSDNSGAIVYNLPGVTNIKTGAGFSIPLFSRCTVNLGYAYSQCTSKIIWLDFAGMTNLGKPRFKEIPEDVNYENQLIYGGISWKF